MSEDTKRKISVINDSDGHKIVIVNDVIFKGKQMLYKFYQK